MALCELAKSGDCGLEHRSGIREIGNDKQADTAQRTPPLWQ